MGSPREESDDEEDDMDAAHNLATEVRANTGELFEEADEEAVDIEKERSQGPSIQMECSRPPLPRRRSESRSDISIPLEETARSESSRDARQEIPRHAERSRSLGARSPPGTALGNLLNAANTSTSSPGRPPRPQLKGLSALNDSSIIPGIEGHVRRQRVSTSLPRPSKILPRAAAAAIGGTTNTIDANAPMWKAVPIKTMSLQLEL